MRNTVSIAKVQLISDISLQMLNIKEQSVNKKLPAIETSLKLMNLSLEAFRILHASVNTNTFSKGGML